MDGCTRGEHSREGCRLGAAERDDKGVGPCLCHTEAAAGAQGVRGRGARGGAHPLCSRRLHGCPTRRRVDEYT